MQRELQIAGSHDEKSDGRPWEHIQDGHPDGIGLREDERALAAQVERLAAVRHDDQEAGDDPHPVDPYLALCCFFNHVAGRLLG